MVTKCGLGVEIKSPTGLFEILFTYMYLVN